MPVTSTLGRRIKLDGGLHCNTVMSRLRGRWKGTTRHIYSFESRPFTSSRAFLISLVLLFPSSCIGSISGFLTALISVLPPSILSQLSLSEQKMLQGLGTLLLFCSCSLTAEMRRSCWGATFFTWPRLLHDLTPPLRGCFFPVAFFIVFFSSILCVWCKKLTYLLLLAVLLASRLVGPSVLHALLLGGHRWFWMNFKF